MQIVAANFKMNQTQEETKKYISSFSGYKPKCRVLLALSYTSLCAAKKHPRWMEIGAQNVHYEVSGAYTGEVSAAMLQEAGASFVLVGHSERRKYFNESNKTAGLRAKMALSCGLVVVFCVGESEEQRTNRDKVLKKQLTEGLSGILNAENLIVAYEPVWAIGTGKVAKKEEIESAHQCIKKQLKKMFGVDVPVLYGGGVNLGNVSEVCGLEGVDGVLVGSAALNPNSVKELIESATKN